MNKIAYKKLIIQMAQQLRDEQQNFHTRVSPDLLEKYKNYEKIEKPRTKEDRNVDLAVLPHGGDTQKFKNQKGKGLFLPGERDDV